MRYYDKKLYLDFAEAVHCGISANTIKKAKANDSGLWDIIKAPEDRRKLLIGYEKLGPANKKKIDEHYGDPYKFVLNEPVKRLVKKDMAAMEFFVSYRYNDVCSLPINIINKYTRAASWLTMLSEVSEDKRYFIKHSLGIDVSNFYLTVCELLRIEKEAGKSANENNEHVLPGDFPASYPRLLKKLEQFKSAGYACLIDGMYGNKLAAKINTDVCESLLLELLANPNQFDDVYVCQHYNIWAEKNGHKIIKPNTVGVWRRKNEHLIISSREGRAAYYDKYSRESKGHRPTSPLLLVESDDNHLDLLFFDPNDNTPHKYYHKYKAIIVTDSYNDYVLGYAISENLTTELVRAAYIDAMHHIKELTGSWFTPREVKTDRWAMKELRPFYQGFANYFETPVGSKQRGYIEQFFGSSFWKRAIKSGANNYSGNNITAKFRGVNVEELDANKKLRPTLTEGEAQVRAFIERLRHTKQDNGRSKQEDWIIAFNSMPDNKKKPLTDEEYLLKFGVIHRPKNGKLLTIHKGGIEPSLNGIPCSFSVPPAHFLQNVGKAITLMYDPLDLSRVLITDNNNLRFIAPATVLNPRALADYKPGDRTLINSILREKEADITRVAQKADYRREILKRQGIDPEALLQSGVMKKELRQRAEISYGRTLEQSRTDRRAADPIDQM